MYHILCFTMNSYINYQYSWTVLQFKMLTPLCYPSQTSANWCSDVLPAWTKLKTKICILFPSSSISECINYWLLFTSYLICGMSLLPWSMTNPGRKISPSEVIMHLTEPSKLYILRCGPSSPSSMLRLRLSICSLLLVLRPVNHSTSGKDMESSWREAETPC